MYYRNRLTRCYLGAVNPKRDADAFTNFDDDDSPRLQDLVQRPYHLVNTALNLTRIRNLAWQERKAAACVLSPLYCGFYLPVRGAASGGPQPQPQGFYERTEDYLAGKGSLRLGAALSISGAAASPNSGYHTSQAVAFLLTVFNVRLGWWLQNPARPDKWSKPGPKFAGALLLKELLAFTDEQSSYVYLSDGGHFDNLGLYELVRRGCRYIIASDAGMDPKFQFEDLGNAIRKCQIDLGVRIEIGVEGIRPDAAGKSLFHCAVGLIHYESSPMGGETGYLLYIKPSLNGNEPTDVAQYQAAHPEFPHQPTSDQWFDESQFESYRRLGRHIGQTVLDGRDACGRAPRASRTCSCGCTTAGIRRARLPAKPSRVTSSACAASRPRSAATRSSHFSTRRSIPSGNSSWRGESPSRRSPPIFGSLRNRTRCAQASTRARRCSS